MLPEDDANKELANGFHLKVDWNRNRRMQVLPAAGGWNNLLGQFKSEHVTEMSRYTERFMVLLIDFDGRNDRLKTVTDIIPEELAERVFVLGAWSDPERLKANLGAYEDIGSAMADDCRDETDTTWAHELLRHNASELDRLREQVRSILF